MIRIKWTDFDSANIKHSQKGVGKSYEKIKNFTILKDRFSEENGQLTPTQKLKKMVVLDAYSADIGKMYADNVSHSS